MASTSNAVLCALVALVFWTAVGVPITRRLLAPPLALAFAPLCGWAVHSVVALLVFFIVPFSAATIAAVAGVVLAASWLGVRGPSVHDGATDAATRISPWAWTAALLLSLAVAVAIVPKTVGDAVVLAVQAFDHAKVSMVDEMARLGLPPGNPYFANDGGTGRLSYYYLLHFGDAQLSRLLGVSGWEADIATTFFAAFTSLAAMMGLAVAFSGRPAASLWVVALAATSSSRTLLVWLFGGPTVDAWLPTPGGMGGWLFQSSWVPQHLISTTCVLLSVLLLHRLAIRPRALAVGVLALVIAAGFESSTWVGGIVFALACLVLVPWTVWHAPSAERWRVVVALGVTAALTLACVARFLVDQMATAAVRGNHTPIVVRALGVFGPAVPDGVRTLVDPSGFWLVLLPVEYTAVFVLGMIAAGLALRGSLQRGRRGTGAAAALPAFAMLALVSLAASWLLVSTFADNNDLGWRAMLLASTALIVLAATRLAAWSRDRRRVAVAVAALLIALGLPEAGLQVRRNVDGNDQPDGRAFARMPAVWAKVREIAGSDERVASNPHALGRLTPWAVNIGWSLLANRRSCYAGWELAQVFTAVPHDRLRRIDEQFVRVFDGTGTRSDVLHLASVYDCTVAVVLREDGAWERDPFRASGVYTLVDEAPDRWRIYRRRSADATASR